MKVVDPLPRETETEREREREGGESEGDKRVRESQLTARVEFLPTRE